MITHKSMLCVGGPRSGQRYSILYGTGFIVPIKDGDVVTHFKYRSEIINTPQGEVYFWVPENQTSLETMALLLETYENSHINHIVT